MAGALLVLPAAGNTTTVVSGACRKTFTVAMAKRAINATFRGTKDVSQAERRFMDRITRCQRNPNARPYVRWYRHHAWKRWEQRRNPPLNGPVTASWFDDSGATACGFHATYGFATLNGTPCGGVVYMKGPSGRLVRAVREDSGPYVGGRMFDLNPALKAALGCGDICSIRYR